MKFIKPNDGTEHPCISLAGDTETKVTKRVGDDEFQELRLAEFKYRSFQRGQWCEPEYFSVGDDPKDAWKVIEEVVRRNPMKCIYAYFFNSSFDWRVLDLDAYLSDYGWSDPAPCITSKLPFLVFTKRDGATLKFIDARNYWRKGTLKEIGHVFGVEKMEPPDFDDVGDAELRSYCRGDVDVLEAIFLGTVDMVQKHDLGGFAVTASAQAFHGWTHRFMPREAPPARPDSIQLLRFEKSAYHGGRVECLQLGPIEDVAVVDVVSMYPAIIHDYTMPKIPLQESVVHPESHDPRILQSFGDDFVIADCLVNINKGWNFLAIWDVKRKCLQFPYGQIHTPITSVDIEFFKEHPEAGRVTKVLAYAAYKEGLMGFREYIDYMMAGKMASPKYSAKYEFFKHMMNDLTGKLGQKGYPDPEWVEDPEMASLMDCCHCDRLKNMDDGLYYERHGGKIQKCADRNEVDATFAWFAMPRIPAKITAMGRVKLFSAMKAAGLKNAYYCDTDSIFLDQNKGLEKLEQAGLVGDKLGMFKIEKEHQCVDIIGPKAYYIGPDRQHMERSLKSIPKVAIQIAEREWEFEHFVTGSASYKNGTRAGVWVTKMRRGATGIYKKGKVLPNHRTEPFRWSEGRKGL